MKLPYLRNFPLLDILIFSTLILGCGKGQDMAGTSSGVDNPKLTVGFRNEGGATIPLSGSLSLFYQYQNTALDPEPIATININNSSFATILGSDFIRRASTPLGKNSFDSLAGNADSVGELITFNMVLRSTDRRGSIIREVVYDPIAKTFASPGKQNFSTMDISPKALVRYDASFAQKGTDPQDGSVYIPGTPFQAMLVDNNFIFEDLPEGSFPLRVLSSDGRILAVEETLDTKMSRNYTTVVEPIGRVDTARIAASSPSFTLNAGRDREAFLDVVSFLAARIEGVDLNAYRVSAHWRALRTSTGISLQPPLIANPTSLQSEVQFQSEGVYHFEIAVTIGLRTERDTLAILVRTSPKPTVSRIIQPMPGDTLILGEPYRIAWETPSVEDSIGLVLSLDGGINWEMLTIQNFERNDIPVYEWIPDSLLAPSQNCLIEILIGGLPVGRMEGPFVLATPAAPNRQANP